ncbi:MAG TPA: ferritin [Planctomycetota bacterium]|nr:ferritin [Planctomycetota bacterium]
MLSKKLNAALNKQMNQEFFSAYTYLSAASHFEEEEQAGFANFFKIQAQEELQHAMKFFDYLHDAGGQPLLDAISAPKRDYSTPLAAFEFSLQHEQKLASDISDLLNLSIAERHAPTQVFLQWFITEQVEEEALFTRWIKRLKRIGNDHAGLLILDKELAGRTPQPAAGAGAAAGAE